MNVTAKKTENIANTASGAGFMATIGAWLDGMTGAGLADFGPTMDGSGRPLDGAAVEASYKGALSELVGKSYEAPALAATAKAKPASPATP